MGAFLNISEFYFGHWVNYLIVVKTVRERIHS